jgi:hypothetical protein
MTWIALFNSSRDFLGYVQFHALPIASVDDYRCMPHGTLSFDGALDVSKELSLGVASGSVAGYHWSKEARS